MTAKGAGARVALHNGAQILVPVPVQFDDAACASNANNLPSGQNQVATNMSYNASVAPGQSTNFGFQASGSATTPTLTCTAN